jgi:hypothetical protein
MVVRWNGQFRLFDWASQFFWVKMLDDGYNCQAFFFKNVVQPEEG